MTCHFSTRAEFFPFPPLHEALCSPPFPHYRQVLPGFGVCSWNQVSCFLCECVYFETLLCYCSCVSWFPPSVLCFGPSQVAVGALWSGV